MPHRLRQNQRSLSSVAIGSFFLAHDGFEAVLEKLAAAGVAFVEADDIAGEQPAHESGQRDSAGPEKEVVVIG
ncbi:hypothetical protein [Geoalkalibacter sp.]|uniref:hypothetical protein n=1 Tax=Geoalkalibacter sp. TaxID=3041440 RepID=UPI00272EA9A8|nr:hypothetical protein [Geoalkalibacter sp.]